MSSAPMRCIGWVISGSRQMAARWRSVGAPSFQTVPLVSSAKVSVRHYRPMPTYLLPDVLIPSWSSPMALASVPTCRAKRLLQDVSKGNSIMCFIITTIIISYFLNLPNFEDISRISEKKKPDNRRKFKQKELKIPISYERKNPYLYPSIPQFLWV